MSVAIAPERDEALDVRIRAGLRAAALEDIGYAYVLDLDRMRFGAYRSAENIYPASVIKVAVMSEAFRRFAEGSLTPDQTVIVSAANQTPTDRPTPFVPGYRATVRQLVDLMITDSDNVATNQLMDVLRREVITERTRGLGLTTFLMGRKLSGSEPLIDDPEITGRNRLPPEEIGRLLALIALDGVPGAADQRAILARCVHDDKLVPGLRDGDTFMHKTGETDETSHDAGILVTAEGRRHVVVLYTTPPPLADRPDAAHVNPHMAAWMRDLRASL